MSNSSIWPIDRTLSGATTSSQSGPGSNSNEGVIHISQSSKTGASPSNSLVSYTGHSFGGRGLCYPLCRDAVSVFCSPNEMGSMEDCEIEEIQFCKTFDTKKYEKKSTDITIQMWNIHL